MKVIRDEKCCKEITNRTFGNINSNRLTALRMIIILSKMRRYDRRYFGEML